MGRARKALTSLTTVCGLLATLSVVPAVAQAQTPPPTGPMRAGPVELTYDAAAGRVRAAIRLDPAQRRFNGRIRLSIGSEIRNGTCFAGNPGDLRVDMTLAWDTAYGTIEALGQGVVARIGGGGSGVTETPSMYTFAYAARQLLARGYRCTTDLVVTGSLPTTTTQTVAGEAGTAFAADLPESPVAALEAVGPATFVGDFEGGIVPPWTAVHRVSADRYRLDTTRVRTPSQSGRVEIRGGDALVQAGQRSEVLWGEDVNLTLRSGDEHWFGWSTWFDAAFPSPGTASSTSTTGHCLFIQWKDFQTGSPPIDLQCRLDRIQIGYAGTKCGGWNMPLVRDGWNDFVVRVRFSATDGQIEIWHRAPGESALSLKLATCTLPTLIAGENSYLKYGYYRRDDEQRTGVLWHDGMRIGTSYDAVVPGDGTTQPPPPDTTPPPVPTGVSATAGDQEVTIRWSAVTAPDIAGYAVYRATDAGGPYTHVTTTASTSYTDTGRTNGTPYFYVVRSLDTAATPNESAASAEVSATPTASPPPPADTTPPPVPTGVSATAGDARVTVAWSAVAASDLAGYRVYRATAAGGPYTLAGTTTGTSYADTGRTNGTRYFYVVRSFDTAGTPNESAASAEVSAVPAAAPVTRIVTVVADADTMVKQASRSSAFGSTNPLIADSQVSGSSSAVNSYLRFTIPTLATGERITAASLRLWVTNSTTNGPAIYRTTTSWTERSMTWSSGRPSRSGTTAVGNFGAMATSSSSTAITGITSAGQVSFELQPESTDDVTFSSRETGTTANRPALVLTVQR